MSGIKAAYLEECHYDSQQDSGQMLIDPLDSSGNVQRCGEYCQVAQVWAPEFAS